MSFIYQGTIRSYNMEMFLSIYLSLTNLEPKLKAILISNSLGKIITKYLHFKNVKRATFKSNFEFYFQIIFSLESLQVLLIVPFLCSPLPYNSIIITLKCALFMRTTMMYRDTHFTMSLFGIESLSLSLHQRVNLVN